MADEIYLNLVRQFVFANNEFVPFAYVMLPAALFPSMMSHNSTLLPSSFSLYIVCIYIVTLFATREAD